MTRVRGALSALMADADDARWLFPNNPRMGYIGWLRRGNQGDEEMFRSFRDSISTPVIRIPLTRAGRVFARGSSVDLLVVGGGTLIGRPEWNVRIREAIRTLSPKRIVSVGTGVVFPGSEISYAEASAALKESARLLRGFDRVTVRGPRSAETLRGVGVDAEAVGDLALLGSGPGAPLGGTASRSAQKRLVLVNVVKSGTPGAPVGSKQIAVLRETLRWLRASGYSVHFFAMESGDEWHARAHFGDEFEVIPFRATPSVLSRMIPSATLVISERLHGGILAARHGVPFLSLAYMAKVADFAESISGSSRVISAAEISDVDALISKCVFVLSDSAGQAKIDAMVAKRAVDLRTLTGGLH